MKKYLALLLSCVLIFGCNQNKSSKKIPVIGFLDFIEDSTIALAKKGFFDALEKNNFSEKDSTIEIVY